MLLPVVHANLSEDTALFDMPGSKVIRPTPYNTPIVAFRKAEKYLAAMEALGLSQEPVDAFGGLVLPLQMDSGAFVLVTLLPETYTANTFDEETIWHEALHLAWFVLDAAGVSVDPSNHEAQTYLQGQLVADLKKKLYKIDVRK